MSVRESTAESVCLLYLSNTYYARGGTDAREMPHLRIRFRKKTAGVLISLEIYQIGAEKEIFDSEVFDR
jgi:hypothetical protein